MANIKDDDSDETTSPRILVVDDDRALRKMMVCVLRQFGLDVDSAANGIEAVQRIQESHFDLIFMDIQMPEMNGLEATTSIRNYELSKGQSPVPIVATTSGGASQQQCLEVGMTDFLKKPVDITNLEQVVKTHLAQPRAV